MGRPGGGALPDAGDGGGPGRLLRRPRPRGPLVRERAELLGGRGPAPQGRRAQRDPDRRALVPLTGGARERRPRHMQTIRLTVAYDGTELHGWQCQPDRPTVQGLLMAAWDRVLGAPTKVVGASRTDAGVHALRQVASLCTSASIGPTALGRALNALLPPAVRVLDAREAPAGFNARRSARGKRYAYLIDRGRAADPFLRRFAWHVPQPIDTGRLTADLRWLRGKRDFSAFCAAPGRGHSPVCTLWSTRVATRERWVLIAVSGDRFLHHMVRNIVGTVVEMGRAGARRFPLDEILESRDRRRAGPTAPAHGLTLLRVLYEPDDG